MPPNKFSVFSNLKPDLFSFAFCFWSSAIYNFVAEEWSRTLRDPWKEQNKKQVTLKPKIKKNKMAVRAESDNVEYRPEVLLFEMLDIGVN